MQLNKKKKMQCKKCKRNFGMLDIKTGLCAFCFREKFGYWSKEFSEQQKNIK